MPLKRKAGLGSEGVAQDGEDQVNEAEEAVVREHALLVERRVKPVNKAAEAVFDELGPGYSESVYQHALAVALREMGHQVEMERTCQVLYRGVYVGHVRADIVMDNNLVLELKTVAKITDAHFAQLRAYMRWLPEEEIVGAVVNFNTAFRGSVEIAAAGAASATASASASAATAATRSAEPAACVTGTR